MKRIIIGLCYLFILLSVISCGKKEENSNTPSSLLETSIQTEYVSKEQEMIGLTLPIEAVSWGMGKEECMGYLSGEIQETVDENGLIHLMVNESVLGSNAVVTLTFKQKVQDDYFANLPDQYLTAIELTYATEDYDAVTEQLTQKYGMEWRGAETNTGKTSNFGLYRIKEIPNEEIKKQVITYLAMGCKPEDYISKGISSEQVWENLTEEDKKDRETIVLDTLYVEVPAESKQFTVKADGTWMLPVANERFSEK